ncbi:MAG TPA: hypothetical protein DEF47_16005 [Herpetosiphon sp.]|uniref:Uncharacterized protein n=1 Tax=Herpetosiphon aurantiacus (strain ATCC 23779 / DSM 785 / 114-95) TaxID=316274 RepID=A9AZL9_HERA2|nr:hypothetical protein [Herpetosiphon sp.]ABX05163.1 conserved hypothetical protein [Herpetosiphon aurantiacus DSM 785]HBW51398.1 hypothetical protein [Herpetosiphon sp.]
MQIVFLLMSGALLLLAVLLLWFVPHLLGQQEHRAKQETQQLKALLSDVLGEQEVVARRQAQLGSSLGHLQDQLETLHTSFPATVAKLAAQPADFSRPLIEHLDNRLNNLHCQLDGWMNERRQHSKQVSQQENESWAYLMSLLGTMQDQLGDVSQQRPRRPLREPQRVEFGSSAVVEDLRDEVESLRAISEEIAALQWRLRRTVASASKPNHPHNQQQPMSLLGANEPVRSVRTL